ncbi:hypothetical protein BGW38_000631, partial [Lunasporangiospora selenospora]
MSIQPQQNQPLSLVKDEQLGQHDPITLSAAGAYPSQPQQPPSSHLQSSAYGSPQQQQHHHHQQQQQSYGGYQSAAASSLASFSALSSNPYSLNSQLMGLSVNSGPTLQGASVGSGILGAGNISGSTTPAMTHASAPSSPSLSHLQYNSASGTPHYAGSLYNQPPPSTQSLYYSHSSPQQHPPQQSVQQHQQTPHAPVSTSSLTASFYPGSPPQPQQQQQQTQPNSHSQYGTMPPAPIRQQQQQQYTPLVPPLSDAQYAQYRQLLGSALSSAASTPYHSNQSTPYSSMPGSPNLEYQQLADPNMIQKPKRRQYGLAETCVDSTRKVRKKGIKRGPYKRKLQATQLGSASASTTPVMSHAILTAPPTGYMSEPVSALNSPTQSHMLPFTSSAMNHLQNQFDLGGYDGGVGHGSYAFHPHRMDNAYVQPYTTSSTTSTTSYA